MIGEHVMGKFKFLQRLLSAIHPPHIARKTVFDDLKVVNADLLSRVKKLQATIDQEDGWFLCLTKDKIVCADEEDEVENG